MSLADFKVKWRHGPADAGNVNLQVENSYPVEFKLCMLVSHKDEVKHSAVFRVQGVYACFTQGQGQAQCCFSSCVGKNQMCYFRVGFSFSFLFQF